MLVALGVCPGEHRRDPWAKRSEADCGSWGVRIRGVLPCTLLGTAMYHLPCLVVSSCRSVCPQ